MPKPKPTPKWKTELEQILRQIPRYDPWHQAGDAWLDHEAAVRAINFFPERLRHVEGSARGDAFTLRPWQAAIVGNLFGWKRRDDAGRTVRRYRKAFIMIGRGNGKTPLAAGIALYAFFEDQEPGAQCYLAAGQREQAGYLFRNAAGFVDQEPDLLNAVDIYRGAQHRSMVLKHDPLSFLKVIAADAASQHGGIPHLSVVDELHVQESRDLLDVFETGMAKEVRAQPLLVMITTSDYDRVSICNEVHTYAGNVRDNGGRQDVPGYDPTFLPVIYEVPADADWTDEREWHKANPNVGVSVRLASLRESCKKAQESPAFEGAFRRLHLNQRTKQELKLISTLAWANCGTPRPDEDDDASPPPISTVGELKGRDCYGGMDLASTDDLASATYAFPLPDEWLAVLSFSFCPAERVIRRARQKYPYDVWGRTGYAGAAEAGLPNFLTGTEGDWIDYRAIRRSVNAMAQWCKVIEIGYDPHGASQLMQDLIEDGLDVVPITQTFGNLAGPTKELMRRVKMRRILHFHNPVLAWAIGNAAAHFDGKLPEGERIEDHLDKVPVMFSKRKSTDKIDPAAAMVLALARMNQHPQDGGTSMYEREGLQVL